MQLICVRHTAVAVPKGVCYGRTDVPLAADFKQEAEAIAQRLRTYAFGTSDAIYTSPLSRCTRLADFCGFPWAIRDSRLLEMDFGSWEMQPWQTIDDPVLKAWFEDWIHRPTAAGDSFVAMLSRVGTFVDELQGRACSRALLFTHGGVIACLNVLSGVYGPQEAFRSLPPCGSVVEIEMDK